MEAKRALKNEQEWEEASGKETAKELEQAWGLVRAPTSAPSKEGMSERKTYIMLYDFHKDRYN